MTDTNIKLHEHEFELLRDFIAQHFGIYFEDNRRWLLESKLSRLLKNYNFGSFLEYYNHLVQQFYIQKEFDDSDCIELIRAISNNETYFYRESDAHEVLTRKIFPDMIAQKKRTFDRTFRVLSAGCSTGEETYSIAITMSESLGLLDDIKPRVIGIDIDPGVLKVASSGVYRTEKLRERGRMSEEIVNKYFSSFNGSHITFNGNKDVTFLHGGVMGLTEFHQINLLNAEAIKKVAPVDVIFCRNVLIYFHQEAQLQAIRNFAEILNPGGYLFLGHSESIIDAETNFTPVENENLIFYQKK